jgi:hypothetical protein
MPWYHAYNQLLYKMRYIKFAIAFLSVNWVLSFNYTQAITFTHETVKCDTVKLLTVENVSTLTTPWQLTFVHQDLQNSVDNLLYKIMASPIDSLPVYIDLLGQTRTEEAYKLLYVACCFPVFVHDINPFNSTMGAISGYGGYQALNKYFFNSAVVNDSSSWHFARDVILICNKNVPKIYYCKPEDYFSYQMRTMEAINTSTYDWEIINIITRYSNLKEYGGIVNYMQAQDAILNAVSNLDFVGDAFFDYCETKIAVYPGWAVLGVIILTDDIPVEKCYRIQVGEINDFNLPIGRMGHSDWLVYKNNYVLPGFIQHQRDLCTEYGR